jgi:hypothetical protein
VYHGGEPKVTGDSRLARVARLGILDRGPVQELSTRAKNTYVTRAFMFARRGQVPREMGGPNKIKQNCSAWQRPVPKALPPFFGFPFVRRFSTGPMVKLEQPQARGVGNGLAGRAKCPPASAFNTHAVSNGKETCHLGPGSCDPWKRRADVKEIGVL